MAASATAAPSSAASSITIAAPASAIQLGVGVLVAAGGVRVGHEDRRAARRGQLEDRAAGAGEDEVARGERVGEGRLVLEQRVVGDPAGGGEPLLCERVVAVPAMWRTWKSRPAPGASGPAKASSAARLIDRAPWLPPKTSRQRAPAAIPKRSRAAPRSAASDRRRARAGR